jgi:ABC-type sugar transport system permease subunit
VAGLLTALPRARELVKTLYLLPVVISTVAIALLFQRIYSLEPVGLLGSAQRDARHAAVDPEFGDSHAHWPLKFGVRFSRKARRPSR